MNLGGRKTSLTKTTTGDEQEKLPFNTVKQIWYIEITSNKNPSMAYHGNITLFGLCFFCMDIIVDSHVPRPWLQCAFLRNFKLQFYDSEIS